MSSPSAVPATRLTTASTAFSSDSQPDSWPDDRPSARSSANSVTRSRAETAALTMNPTIANSAAATKPMASAPMIPSATGSVARACRALGRRLDRGRAADDGVAKRSATAASRPSTREPPLVGRLDRVAALEPQQAERRQVDDERPGASGRSSGRPGPRRRCGPPVARRRSSSGTMSPTAAPSRRGRPRVAMTGSGSSAIAVELGRGEGQDGAAAEPIDAGDGSAALGRHVGDGVPAGRRGVDRPARAAARRSTPCSRQPPRSSSGSALPVVRRSAGRLGRCLDPPSSTGDRGLGRRGQADDELDRHEVERVGERRVGPVDPAERDLDRDRPGANGTGVGRRTDAASPARRGPRRTAPIPGRPSSIDAARPDSSTSSPVSIVDPGARASSDRELDGRSGAVAARPGAASARPSGRAAASGARSSASGRPTRSGRRSHHASRRVGVDGEQLARRVRRAGRGSADASTGVARSRRGAPASARSSAQRGTTRTPLAGLRRAGRRPIWNVAWSRCEPSRCTCTTPRRRPSPWPASAAAPRACSAAAGAPAAAPRATATRPRPPRGHALEERGQAAARARRATHRAGQQADRRRRDEQRIDPERALDTRGSAAPRSGGAATAPMAAIATRAMSRPSRWPAVRVSRARRRCRGRPRTIGSRGRPGRTSAMRHAAAATRRRRRRRRRSRRARSSGRCRRAAR